MKNKTVLITGSTDGIGLATALILSNENHIIIHGRNPEKCLETVDGIKKANPDAKLDYICSDLSSLKQVKKMSDEIANKYKIDALINNAGVFLPRRELTEDGIEKTFAVNYLSRFYLTILLIEHYNCAGPKIILNVSSMAHSGANDKRLFDDLMFKSYYNGHDAYALSKLCDILFTYKLSESLADKGILVDCLHPGVIMTKLLKAGWPQAFTAANAFLTIFSKITGILSKSDNHGGMSLNKGAMNVISAIEAIESRSLTGKYFVSGSETRSSNLSYDKELQDKLWDISEKMTGKISNL